MKKLLLLFLSILSATAFSQSDNCSSATVITPNAGCVYITGTSAGATQSIPGCVGYADDDVWYQFVATATSHQITVTPSAGYDPVLQLFSGGCAVLNNLYCEDLNNTGQAEVINATGLTIGNTYHFRIYHYWSGSGSSTFSVCVSAPPTAPVNDACTNASLINPNSSCVNTAGTSYGATQSYTSTCYGSPDDDVWYKFVANSTQQVITVTPSANMDAVIELLSGTCGSFTSLDCIDNNGTGGTETGTESNLTVGATYYVRVFDYWSGNGGFPFDICITGAAATGDDPCNAFTLPAVSSDCNYITLSNAGFTSTSIALAPTPSTCGGSGAQIGGFGATSHDVWFALTVPASGNIFITSEPISSVGGGAITDGVMALYSGACGSLTQIACDDDHTAYPATANDLLPYLSATGLTPGATVYIRYWGYGSNTGNFGFCVSSPTNDVCSSALYICDLNGYKANTNGYTADRPCNMRGDAEFGATYSYTPGATSSNADAFGMGGAWGLGQPTTNTVSTSYDVSIDNNSWIKFTASATSATFSITVGDCFSTGGVQMQIFSGSNCCGFVPVSDFQQGPTGFVLTANNTLTVGQDYYLMVDGWGSDLCNYTVTANSGVQVPTISAAPSTICYGDSTKISINNASAGSTFLWFPGGQTTSSITVAPPTNMTYSCQVSGVCGNKQTLSKAITVNVLPTVLVNGSPSQTLSICANTTTTLTASGGTGNSYTWTPTTGLSASTGSLVTITPTSTTNTTYTVTGANASGCKSTATITIKGLALPSFSVTNVHPSTCNSFKDTLIIVPNPAGTYTYTWSNGATTNSITPTITSNTVLTAVVTNTNNCTSSLSSTVTVLALPTVTSNTASTCNGVAATLTVTGASTYTWSPSATLSASTGTTVAATPTVPTTYTITATAANGCVNTGTTAVSVSPLPTVQINGSGTQTLNICAGTTTTLTASGASTYSWTPSTGLSASSGNVVTTVPTATTNTTYTITGTSASGCKNTATINIVGLAPPSFSITNVHPSTCNNLKDTLTAVPTPVGTYTYSWSSGASTNSITPTITANTVLTVTITNTNNCKSTLSSTVTMLVLPSISSNTATVCNGQNATLTGSGGVSYTWTPSATLSSGGISTNSVTANPSAPTNYTIVGTGANGCVNTNTTTVNVNSLPNVTVNSATICAGANPTLTAGGATTYSWSTAQTGSSISVSPSSTASYTVTGTDGNNCKNTAVSTVSVNPIPTIIATPTISSSNCGAATGSITSIGITGVGGLSYTWTNSYGQVVGNTQSINNDSAGTYNVHVTDANCSANFGPFSIINPGAPGAPTVTASNTVVCVGQSINVSASSAASSPIYGWTGPNSFSSSSATFTLNPAQVNQSGIYAVTVTSAGCKGPAQTVTLTINPLPLVNATSSPSYYCAGSTVNLNGSSATSYTWSGPGTYTSNAQNPQIINSTTLTTGVYTLTATDGNGCTNTDTANVTVNLTPSLSGISANTNTLCAGQTLQLNATATPTTAIIQWNGPNGYASPPQSTSIPNLTVLQSGTYSVTATIGSCTSATNTLNVVVNPTPIATASVSGSNMVCAGANVDIVGGASGNTYVWNGPSGYNSSLQNNTLTNVATSATGIYTLTVTNSFSCTASDTTSLTVNLTPTLLGVSANTNTLCAGQTLQLNATATPTTAIIQWNGPNGYASPPQSTTIPNLTTAASGTYSVTATIGTCASATNTLNIVVNPLPIPIAGISSSVTCSGSNIILTGAGGATYSWSGPNGYSSTQNNNTLTNVSPSSTGIYTLTVLTTFGCFDTATVSLLVNPTPIIGAVSTNANSNTFCAGQTIILNATTNPTTATLQWVGPNGYTSPPQSTTITNATIAQSGTYSVTAIVGTCTSIAGAVTVTVNPTPTAQAAASNSVVCSGGNASLLGNGGGGYSWSGPAGYTSSLPNNTLTNVSASAAGIYTLVVTNSFNCTDTATTSLQVYPTPASAVTANAQTCIGGTLTLSATGNGTINWYSDAALTNLVNTGTTFSPTVPSGTTAIYYVVVTSTNSCSSATSTSVSVGNYNVQVAATASTYNGDAPLSVNFAGMITGASNPSYSWTLGDNASSLSQNPSHTYNNGGDYVVILTGIDSASSCIDTAMLTIHITDAMIIIIPNIFTPNGDNINDGFFITSQGVKSIEGFIMNRWGQMMFTWTGLNSVWDGTAPNGNKETDGVYFYVLTITSNKGEAKEYKGTVTLIR